MSENIPPSPPAGSSIGSLIASRRRRRGDVPLASATGQASHLKALRTGAGIIEGHAYDPSDLTRRLVVELILDGVPAQFVRADLFDPALGSAAIGDGAYGFVFHIDPGLIPYIAQASVRLANSLDPVGDPIDLTDGETPFAPSPAPFGMVEWTGGLDLAGWVRREAGAFPVIVEARVDGTLVATARADIWRSVTRGETVTAEPGFALTLPRALADGRARRVEITCDKRALTGSPVSLIAFPDGLEAFLDEHAAVAGERLRGRLFDTRFPASVPFGDFEAFDQRFARPSQPSGGGSRLRRPVAIAVVGEAGAETSLADAALQGPDALPWVGAILPSSGPTGFRPQDLTRFLGSDGRDSAVVVMLTAGARLRPGGLERLVASLEADPAAEIAYGDCVLERGDGSLLPLALPAFDYERALEQGLGHAGFAIRREAALDAARRGVDDMNRLFLAPLEGGDITRGVHLHVPGFALTLPTPDAGPSTDALAAAARAHLAALGVEADVVIRPAATLPAVRVTRKGETPGVTLVLDAEDGTPAVLSALATLEPTRRATGAGVVVTARQADDALRESLRLSAIELVERPLVTSRTERLGAAVDRIDSAFVCFLDPTLRIDGPDWLAELLSRGREADVGAVAPLLARDNGLVAEAGLVLRPDGAPAPAFADRPLGDPGYGDALHVAHQVGALSHTCLLTRRADFVALGGFDPLLFPTFYGAVDYSLKLQALGRRLILAPDARLVVTRATLPLSPLAEPFRAREAAVLQARWGAVLARDPFYSPLLSRGERPYGGLAWPPGNLAARRSSISAARDVPPGW